MNFKIPTLLIALNIYVYALFAQSIDPQEVKSTIKLVADWQIDHFQDKYSNPKKAHHPLDWTNGALYVGMVKWANIADDDKYFEWLKAIGNEHNWNLQKRKYHADDHTVGQMYCELYRKYNNEQMIAPTIEQFNYILYHPANSTLKWKSPYNQDRWSWCDALFMSPPVWAKLFNITGDEKYLQFMMDEFKATTNYLFDKKEGLYYRDDSYINKPENGNKVFWARGNGWVYAGLTNIMNELNPKSKEYKYFLDIYKKMSKKLLQIQTEGGHWAMSLLSSDYYPTPETSGTAFFVYGLAWGINNNILDKKSYEPAVIKGWKT